MCIRAGLTIDNIISCSHQAFSKARAGIDHTVFQECFIRMVDFMCAPGALEYHRRLGGLWGIQVIAIDGSRITLPNRKYLLEKYGGMGRDASSPTAIASIAYDVLNKRILDAQFEPLSCGERSLAERHINTIKDKKLTDPLYTMYVFERGYASKKMIHFLAKDINSRYLFRLREKFNPDIDLLPVPASEDDIVDHRLILYGDTKVRVLRFLLPGGTVETLLTNDFSASREDFKYLYFLRWPVEEEYRLIKQKVGLENFRGYSENSILQEFWIAVLLANLTELFEMEADGIIKAKHEARPNLKHSYKTNVNELIGCLSRHITDYMDARSISEKQGVIKYIIGFAVKHKVVDKKGKGESNPRAKPRDSKFHYNIKFTH